MKTAYVPWVQTILRPVLKSHAWTIKPFSRLSKTTTNAIKAYERNPSKERFGTLTLPIAEVIELIENSPAFLFEDFTTYHRWYASVNPIPDHPETNRWPIILSREDRGEPILEDGWHRLHDYFRKKATVIPCVFYTKRIFE